MTQKPLTHQVITGITLGVVIFASLGFLSINYFLAPTFALSWQYGIVYLLVLGFLGVLLAACANRLAALIFVICAVGLYAYGTWQGYEESYCWHQGELADPSGQKMVPASDEDAKLLADYQVHSGNQISVAFRAHMLCHVSHHTNDVSSSKHTIK